MIFNFYIFHLKKKLSVMYAAEIHVQLYVAIMMQSSFMFFWTVGLHVQFGKNLS